MESKNTSMPLFTEDKLEEFVVDKTSTKDVKIINENNAKSIEVFEPLIVSLNEITKYKQFYIALHPFIIYGYRIHHNFLDCIKSIFTIHNETLNIWTHLLSLIVATIGIYYVYTNTHFKPLTETWVAAFYLFSVIACFFCSTNFHTFNCHSGEVSDGCFKMDFLGIILVLLSGVASNQYFMFHNNTITRIVYITFYLTICFFILNLNRFTMFEEQRRNTVRIILVMILVVLCYLSYVHWCFVADLNEIQVMTPYMLMAFFPMVIGFLFYFSKFPESSFQNKFIDLYLQSHTIWHLMVSLAAFGYFNTIYKYSLLIDNNKL